MNRLNFEYQDYNKLHTEYHGLMHATLHLSWSLRCFCHTLLFNPSACMAFWSDNLGLYQDTPHMGMLSIANWWQLQSYINCSGLQKLWCIVVRHCFQAQLTCSPGDCIIQPSYEHLLLLFLLFSKSITIFGHSHRHATFFWAMGPSRQPTLKLRLKTTNHSQVKNFFIYIYIHIWGGFRPHASHREHLLIYCLVIFSHCF